MKVGLCCIAKMENEYIIDFVNYYRQIGVDKIYIYDNNDTDYEPLYNRIKDFVDDNFVEIIDVRNGKNLQLPAYVHCWHNHRNEFDWMMFVDCDEYLFLKQDKNIKDYLSRDIFHDYDMIHINWVMMDDGGLIKSNGRPLMERCYPSSKAKLFDERKFSVNYHIKSIIKCHNEKVGDLCFWNPHSPTNDGIRCCDDSGKEVDSKMPFVYKITNEFAYFKHFHTKTIDEWIHNKIPKGYADHQMSEEEIKTKKLKDFFSMNEITKEKEEYIKEILK